MATGINDKIGAYQIVEVAARGARSLFLATRNVSEGFVWLLEAEQPLDEVRTTFGMADLFAHGKQHYAAIDVSAPSLASLLTLVPSLDEAFIGWRWVKLADFVGQLHKGGQTLPPERPLTLSQLRFTRASQLSLSPYAGAGETGSTFRAPEIADGMPTPQSDVYALAAALQTALGGSFRSRKLAALLGRATDAEAARRPADGTSLAAELKRVLPRRQLGEVPDDTGEAPVPKRSAFSMIDGAIMALGPIAAFGILVLGILAFRDGFPDWLRAWIPNFGGFGTSQSDGARGGRARSTDVPLPDGPLTFDRFALDVAAPCAVRLDVTLHKGGVPLPTGASVDFDVWLNGRIVTGVVISPAGEQVRGGYQIVFNAPGFCPGGGAVLVRARVAGAEGDLSLCDFGKPESAASVARLDGLSFVAAQVDATAYPDMAAYFTVADNDGVATRLRGAFRCRLLHETKEVKEFEFHAANSELAPLTVALVMDVSGSMKGDPLANAQQAAGEFVRQLGANQSVCVIAFASTVRRVQECSTKQQATLEAIGSLTAGGDTALFDAIINVAATQGRLGGRQAVVVLSDGEDTVKRSTLDMAIERARSTNVPFYTIGLLSPDFNGAVLREIAAKTGGIYLEAPRPAALKDLYLKVRGQLTTQYQLRFHALTPEKPTGNFSLSVSEGETTITLTRPFVSQTR